MFPFKRNLSQEELLSAYVYNKLFTEILWCMDAAQGFKAPWEKPVNKRVFCLGVFVFQKVMQKNVIHIILKEMT